MGYGYWSTYVTGQCDGCGLDTGAVLRQVEGAGYICPRCRRLLAQARREEQS